MLSSIEELLSAIKAREGHLFIIHGNVYDTTRYRGSEFTDIVHFLIEITGKKFPQCMSYNIFSGLKIVRGDEKKITTEMGIAQQGARNDPNADLINALKQAKGGNGTSSIPANPVEIFPCFDRFFEKTNSPSVLIIDHAESIIPASIQNMSRVEERALCIAIDKWSRDRTIREKPHLIFLIVREATGLNPLILDRTCESIQIRISKPEEEERKEFFLTKNMEPPVADSMGKITAGLCFKDLSRVTNMNFTNGAGALEEKLDSVFLIKQKILRDEYADLLEIMQPKNGFEAVGGLDEIIAELEQTAMYMREGRTSLVPKGIMFCGPAGTGKTIMAEALAKNAGVNLVKPLDIMSMWLGESERRMTRFCNALIDSAPVIVFIDEFDQNQGRRGEFDGTSGTQGRLFKKSAEIMSNDLYRGKILWLFATNRPELIDSAIKRPGRCDLIIPFPPANEKQLVKICKAAFLQYQYREMKHEILDWTSYARKCNGYSGAQMIEVIRRAWKHANKYQRTVIIEEDMQWACQDYKPSILNRGEVARQTLLAFMECSSRSLLPANWQDILRDFFPNDYQDIADGLNGKNTKKETLSSKEFLKLTSLN